MINFNKQNLPFFKFKKNTTSSLKILLTLVLIVMGMQVSWGQTYYSMSSGNYSESFTSWTTPSTGTNWSSVAIASVGTIPVATNMTVSSASFTTTTTGGLQNGSTNIQFLSTGASSSSSSVAFDLNLNFTGRTAGTFSFDAATVNNSTGDRIGSLKVYYSINGTSWTELTGTNLPYVATNNVVGSASISISLPSALDNQSTVKLRFYNYNGTATGSTGSRPKISIDNVAVTSTTASSTNYYSKSTGNLNDVANWGTNTDGTGTAPTNFTTANQVFNIRNNATPTIGAAWTVSGSGSKIIVGDATNACNFTIPALYAVTGTVDVSAGATLTNTNTTIPTLGTLSATSTVVFNAAGTQTVPIATYGNLSISNTGSSTATAAGATTVTNALTISSGSTFDMSTFALTGAALTTSGTGTLKTQNVTATPLPTGRTWTMDVLYNSASSQTVVSGTHANLNLTGGNRTLIASGTINISGTYTPGAGTLTVISNTINFNGADGQTIPAATYNILTSTNNTRTLANGVIKIASTFTPGSSNYTIGTSTVEFNGSSAKTIPVLPVASGGNYYNLTYSGSSTGTLGGSVTVAGDFVQSAGTFQVTSSATSSAITMNLTGNATFSNAAIFNLLNSTINGAAATVTVTGNTTTSGTSSINLESVDNTNASGKGIFQTTDFTTTSTNTSIVDFGATTVTGNEFRISGNFSKSGTGKFNTSSASASSGFVFNKSGTQTFSYSGANSQYTQYLVNSGSTLQLSSSLTMGSATNPRSTFTLNGTLDMGTNVISGTTDPTFTLGATGAIITSNTGGLVTAITTPGTNVFTAGASYTFNGATTTPFHSTTLGNPSNLIINANVTLNKSSTITNSLSLTSGTLTVGANTLTHSGSTINRDGTTYIGNIDASNASATVAFTNSSALTIPASTFTGTCKNITMNGAGGLTLGSDLTIGGTLTFTSGKITTGANKVILTSAASVSRTSGHVVGNMQKNVAVSATSRTFEIGDASNYTPITLALTSVTVAGDLTASTSIPGAAPASASGIHPTKYLNRYWTLTNSGITLTSFDPTFTFVSGDIQGSAATSSFIGAKLTSSAWTNPTVGTLTSTSSQLTGVTSFGDFYLGEPGTPTVTSSAASSISTTGAVLNGTVNDNGSATTIAFDYGTTTSYGSSGTASPASILSGAGATSVTSTIGSLSVNTQYNYRANATNSLGTTNGSNLTFYTLANTPGTPTVNNPTNTTLDVLIDVNSNPSNTQFAIQETVSGNYVQANGSLGASAVWQTASVWGTETVTGLSGGTLYTFQVKARNGDNTETSFGTSANGTTSSSVVPTISTPTATAILSTTATLGGNVTSDGGAAISARGLVWSATSLNPAPQLSGSNVTNVAGTGTTGVFTTSATSLPTATQISYSAYATNSQGTSYTSPTTFYTLATEPSSQATAIVFSSQSASSLVVSWTNGNGGRRAVFMKASAGSITNPSDANAYTASSDWNTKGTQLGTSGYYCIYDGTGSTVTVTNLLAQTSYYVQVFDYNSDVTPTAATINYNTATASGNPGNSITLSSNISAHAASFSAAPASTTSLTLTFSAASTITNAAGYIILQKSGNSAPTGTPTNATSYSVGNTIGDGTVAAIITNTATTSTTISGLAYATLYSFTLIPFNWDATNTGTYNYYTAATIPSATGTTSTPTSPTVTTPTSASVSNTTATLGGNVTSDGGDPVTARGIVWSVTSLNADPVIGGSNVNPVLGTGTTGVYTVATTGLTSEVSISYKAYATNNYGTSYTTVGTFTTLAAQPTTQASNITFANVGMNSMTINWTNGNGTNRMVVVKASGAPGTPSDGQTYTANTIFGSGSSFGTSEYVVYTGANNTVDITGLTASITYSVKVFEYNGSGASINYLTTTNNTSQTTSSLSYYSNGSGDPALLASWKTERNGTGSSPVNFTSGESFVIESGDVMTTTTVWAISGTNSKLQIESGGTLSAGHAITLAAATTFQIDNGGTYNHNNTGSLTSTIFSGTEVFGASSNFIINNTPTFTAPSSPGYGNLTINTSTNATSVGLSSTLAQVQGNLTFTSTGTGAIRYALLGTGSTTLNIGGNLSLNGTTALFYFSSGTGTASVTVAGDLIVSSGTLDMSNSGSGGAGTLNIGGNFNQTGGTIKSTSSNVSTINFTGSGKTFTQSGGTLTNTNIIWTIADGASLTLINNLPVATSRTLTVGGGTSGILDCSSLAVSGAGTFTLSAGATLKTAHASGISGAITATTKSFNSAANYEFNGAATGTFTTTPTSSTVNNLTINNSGGVILSQNLAVAGASTQTSGKLSIGAFTLTLNGTYVGDATNSLTGSTTSNLTLGASLGTIYFDQTTPGTTNVLKNLTLSGSGTTTLGNALNITSGASFGTVIVGNGATLATGGNLTLKSDVSGTACIGISAGLVSGNVTIERFVASAGRRFRFLSSPVQSATIADWMTQFYVTGPGTGSTLGAANSNGWHTTQANINAVAVTTTSIRTYNEALITGDLNTGWENLTGTSQALTPGKGFRTFIRGAIGNTGQLDGSVAGQTALTLSLTGAVNAGDVNSNATFNSSGTAANDGWNLVGNPYPCGYSILAQYNATQTSDFNNVSTQVHIYNGATGGYNSYNANGGASTGAFTNGVIPSGSAFFIQATATPTFIFKEAYKTSTAPGGSLHKTASTSEFAIKYSKDSTESDYLTVKMYDNATLNYDAFDIKKLRNENLNLAAYGVDVKDLAASVIPFVNGETRIKLNVEATEVGTYKFDFTNMDNFDAGVSVSLFDRYTNKTTDVKTNTKYTFDMGAGVNQWGKNRFELILNGKATTGINNTIANNTENTTLSVYPNPATDVLNISLSNGTTIETVNIYNVSGKLVNNTKLNGNQIDISQLNNGVYMVEVITANGSFKTKFVK